MTTPYLQKPSCFGQHWDPKDAACAGGPNLKDKERRCELFESCGQQTQSARMEAARAQAQRVIPPSALVRQNGPPVLQSPSSGQSAFQRSVQALHHQQQQAQHYQQQYQPQPVPVQQTTAGFQPQAYQPLPVNYNMPSYLAVQENRGMEEGIITFGLRTVFRSMLKGGAHGLAHLVDVTPLKKQ